MRFYKECANVAKSIGALMTTEQCAKFARAPRANLAEYYLTLGLWIRHHLLPHNAYLCEALEVLGLATPEEKVEFLVEFSQQYWQLVIAEMI